VREGSRHRFAGAPIREDPGQLELWVGGDEPQQFAGHQARAAEHDGRYAMQGLLA